MAASERTQTVMFEVPVEIPLGPPDDLPEDLVVVKQFNFASRGTGDVEQCVTDHGDAVSSERGYGWSRRITQHRRRGKLSLLPDTYVLTRTHDVWECVLPSGDYTVDLSIGDSAYEQFGQNVTVEGQPVFRNHTTRLARFAEKQLQVTVSDGKLTVEIGLPGSKTNTCLNWLRIAKRR